MFRFSRKLFWLKIKKAPWSFLLPSIRKFEKTTGAIFKVRKVIDFRLFNLDFIKPHHIIINKFRTQSYFLNNSSLEWKTSLPHCACVTCMNEFICEKVTHTDFACNIYWKLPLSPLFIAKLIMLYTMVNFLNS